MSELEEDQLRAESAEIEQLLEEIQQLVTAPAWQRVERVIGRVVRLYGAGLAHALGHARRAGASDTELDRLVTEDDMLASLLALHGLHPLPIEQRIRRALIAAQADLGLEDGTVTFVSVTDRVVQLHAQGPLGGAMASRVAEGAIKRVVETAAPEIKGIEISGIAAPPREPELIQIRTRREVP